MNVLEKIVASKKIEVEQKRKDLPLDLLTKLPLIEAPVRSLKSSIKNGSGIIAEYKRRSPSAGIIQDRPIEKVIDLYNQHQVSGYSVLTDKERFDGSIADLIIAREQAAGPILRKEFIVDEYQVFEAKAHGADAILLIAEALDQYHATHLTTIAQSLGLEVLMEFHSIEELEKLNDAVDVIGINNRDLKTLKTDISKSEELIKYLPYKTVKITESGIKHPDELGSLYAMGYEGCLIGEAILQDSKLLSQLTDAANNFKLVSYEA